MYTTNTMKQPVNNKFSLNEPENFNKELDVTPNAVMAKYSELLIEYTKFIVENIQIKNKSYSKFIIIRGLDTITNVFTTILYYTKNLDLTFFHCQKSYYFYVEFISQISEAEKLFLQLSSRDASTYVYKKTLFDLNNSVLKPQCSGLTKFKFDVITETVKLHKTIMLKIIHHCTFKTRIEGSGFEEKHAIDQFEEITKQLMSTVLDLGTVIKLTNVVDLMFYRINSDDLFLESLHLLVKKLAMKHDIVNSFEQNMNNFLNDWQEDVGKLDEWLSTL